MSHRDGVLGWPGRVPHVVKYALSYLFAQSEFGLLCPVNMTDSTARMLTRFGDEALRGRYLPRLTATALEDLWQGTQWMTEKTGGSDVGALTTLARRDADGAWRLWGDKWFASNANADVALTLARPEGAPPGTRGLGLFLVPRHLPDGTKNAWTINRLKDKLGSRSMATGEVTYAGAVAYVVGDVGRGFAQMMEMVNGSRLSNAMRAAGIMRRSLLEAEFHARGRAAFGGALFDKPRMRWTLLEMLLDVEAAASVVLNAAVMFDAWDAGAEAAGRLLRIVTPLAKGWITGRAPAWTTQPPDTRELEARPVAETLYHALATALLLDEGQTLRPQRQDHHKLLVAALYARRWLVPAPPGVPAFSPSALESLERLVDWRPIGADALAAEAPLRD